MGGSLFVCVFCGGCGVGSGGEVGGFAGACLIFFPRRVIFSVAAANEDVDGAGGK